MSTTVRRTEEKIVKEMRILVCDGCGKEVGDNNVGIGPRVGWLQQTAYDDDGKGNAPLRHLADFCTDCRPKIERAQKQEIDAIKAEALAALADVRGVV